MAEAHDRPPEKFTLRLRRYDPESGDAPYWDEHTVELEPHRSVLEAILQAKDRFDGSIGVRCSCRQAICGSCGVRVNGEPALACHTHLDAAMSSASDGVIEIEPMGNMPVLKDLIVDMDAVHWKKIRRVTPWLLAKQPVPEREYIVPKESMVDVTQTMACIQCGACVSDCLAMEVDPGFIGPAALAKAYRFVGDPRDDEPYERLNDLAQDPQGIFDCTHCFKCVEACPKDVNPMGQIMRLRRIATADEHIVDQNNGERHEAAFTTLIKDNGLLWETELLPRSYGGNSWFGKFAPPAGKELLASLPVVIKALMRRKFNPLAALKPHRIPSDDLKAVQSIFDRIESREERYELNLYIVGEDEEPITEAPVAAGVVADVPLDPPDLDPVAAARAESGVEGAASAPGPEGATAADPTSGDQGAERSAPAGESIAESSPPPVDPGPPAVTGTEGEPPVEHVGPGSEPAPEEAAGEGEEATGDTAHQSGSTPEESES
jgi:succinate dehydrogenase / fumarate reductase, iron-sulfur subunit